MCGLTPDGFMLRFITSVARATYASVSPSLSIPRTTRVEASLWRLSPMSHFLASDVKFVVPRSISINRCPLGIQVNPKGLL